MAVYPNIIRLNDLLRKAEVSPFYFILAAAFSLVAAAFEAISLILLIPLANGVVQMNFVSAKNLPFIGDLILRFSRIFAAQNTAIFIFLVGAIFISAVLKNILEYTSSLLVSYQIGKFGDNTRRIIFERYLSFGKSFFDRNNAGYLQNIQLNFTSMITKSFRGLERVISEFFMLIVYLSVMFWISWKLTLFISVVFPVLNYSARWLIEKIKKASGSLALAYGLVSERIANILSCIPLVKLYNRQEQEKEEFGFLSERVRMLEFSMDKKQVLLDPLQEIVLLVAVLLLISAMAFLAVKNKAGAVGSFLVFFYLLKRASNSFGFLNKIKSFLATVGGPASSVLEVFNDKEKFFIADGKNEFPGLKRVIEFRQLSFSYPDGIEILKGLDFSVEKGRVTAIVGPTGSGKTTLISLILRFYDCPPSSIMVDGVDIRDFTISSLVSHIALVSQDDWLFNDSIKNNMIYGLGRSVSEDELIAIAKKARLDDFIMSLPDKFDSYIGDKGVKLSGGEKQRVAIARALLKRSEILILDEATSSLDTKTEKLIQETIEEAVRGRTSIVIAHRLSTIRNADKIVVIENGRFIEDGSLDELFERKGKFYEYWEEQRFD